MWWLNSRTGFIFIVFGTSELFTVDLILRFSPFFILPDWIRSVYKFRAMSNSNLLNRSLLCPPVILNRKHARSPSVSCGGDRSRCRRGSIRAQSTSLSRNLRLSEFHGQRLLSSKDKLSMARQRSLFGARAVLSTCPVSQLAGKFSLDGQMELQVKVISSTAETNTKVEFHVTNTNAANLVLHWGAIRDKQVGWVLPSRRPEKTTVFMDQALRTPFQVSGVNSFVQIEIDDPALQAIEFLVHMEEQDIWFKNKGENFYVKFSTKQEEVMASKKGEKKCYSTDEKIERSKGDLMEILHKSNAQDVENPQGMTTPVELYAMKQEEKIGNADMKKNMYVLGDKQLVAILSKPAAGKTKVSLATDLEQTVVLHWALSTKGKEWVAPPSEMLPSGTVPQEKAAETDFTSIDDPHSKVKVIELEFEDGKFVGMPFVVLNGGNWIKNNGSDFYIDFKIADLEEEAQKSFMHRFNIAADLLGEALEAGELGLAGILVWMRFMATRQLVWNKNYNVKPREISKAQDRLTNMLQDIFHSHPEHQESVRLILSTVGRGGEGDVGQRIRDEILVIQRNNDCKGGMMEEWHQKLHNNTSPDDVIICQALMNYIKSDLDISVYWKTLNENGITKDRLLSYDRAIHSEPQFRDGQKEGLLRDLKNYMRSLKAVHSGADLEAAVSNCVGYCTEGQDFMVGFQISPISGLPSGFPELVKFVLEHVEDKNVNSLLEGILKARTQLKPLLSKPHDRLKDLLFLDIALDSTVRTAVERGGYNELNDAGPERIICLISLVLQNLALSSDDNEDLIYCLKGWKVSLEMLDNEDEHWALYAKSVLDRTRLSLASKAERYQSIVQPSAEYLGSLLDVDQCAVSIFTEELIRSGSAASLSSLLNQLDPVLRRTANLGSWQLISPVEAVGYVVVVDKLLSVQDKSFDQPTILVVKTVKGEEEIPDGAVAVLTPDMPDVLSHVSVRARNSKVCFATCFDSNIFSNLQASEGKLLSVKPQTDGIVYREVNEVEGKEKTSRNLKNDSPTPSLCLAKKKFCGKYAISSEEFTNETVGAKSQNIGYLKGKVPSSIKVPTSVALPFGVFEEVLSDSLNKEVAEKLKSLKENLGQKDVGALEKIRRTILELAAPSKLEVELKEKMKSSGMPWPGDEGDKRWDQAWMAIKRVWASKWNERAYFSTKKVGLNHDDLCMAVLVQEVISADYAFVIHTTNPSSGDSTEIYAEVVKGLGETLVGAFPGRALSFICKKDALDSPMLLGYPSKPIGLFIDRSIIFRSDSNGEDLEGYAGAGLYDSVPMDEESKVVLDYTSDPLIVDANSRKSILSAIARAGYAIEELYGTPQDIEGVIKDQKIYVVQTRPQM
ncbi:hypothetical protein V2J09_003846 [Rumex salicifolius]